MSTPSTFSIVAVDLTAAEWGIAVQSKFLAVGSAVPWAKAGCGAIATQAYVNTSYGPKGLALLDKGLSAQEVIDHLVEGDRDKEFRQVGVVDAAGGSASFTGKECMDWAGSIVEDGFACQGNILVSAQTVHAMAKTYTKTAGETLAIRLLASLKAGQKAGGDRRGKQSAALFVVKKDGGYGGFNDRYIDLRVDDHTEPIEELERIYQLHQLYFSPPKATDLVKINPDLARRLKQGLAKLGYYAGGYDDNWSDPLKEALFRFCGTENLEEHLRDDDKFDIRILRFMEALLQEKRSR